MINYICTECKKKFKLRSSEISSKCPQCGGILWIDIPINIIQAFFSQKKQILNFWDYKSILPAINQDFIVSLGEGITPCRKSKRLGEGWGINDLYFKDETHNPTNSFKDRAGALLVSHARSLGYEKIICGSNGNQGASIAAYASLEGMKCLNIIPKKIDVGKRAQMIAYDSEIKIMGHLSDVAIQETLKQKYNDYYQATPECNILTLEGQKIISYELIEQISEIDGILIPMGSGGLLVSIWKGFRELEKVGQITQIPKMVGVQTKAYSPIVDKFNNIPKKIIKKGWKINSHALGILVKKPYYQDLALKAIQNTNGIAISIPEDLILSATEELASREGIFAEPASALTVAALKSLLEQNLIEKDEKIVCLITGSGLKTPYMLKALSTRAKTAGMGGILSTKLKILSQISLSKEKGIYGSKLKEMMGSISLPAVYQHLKELERKELIIRRKEGKKVFYTITNKGKKILEALETLITLF